MGKDAASFGATGEGLFVSTLCFNLLWLWCHLWGSACLFSLFTPSVLHVQELDNIVKTCHISFPFCLSSPPSRKHLGTWTLEPIDKESRWENPGRI